MKLFWGRYVAFLHDAEPETGIVIREPMSNLPCFYTTFEGATLFFSWLPDVLELIPRRFCVNRDYLRAHVAAGSLFVAGTALDGVHELPGGMCVVIRDGRAVVERCWQPTEFTRADSIEDPIQAADLLRSTVKTCTHAWASTHSRILHRLSGGLDSSIVLGCLGDAPACPDITCVTHFVPGGSCDERPYARLAAGRSRCTHIELARHVNWDFAKLGRMAPTVNPAPHLSFLEKGRIERHIAEEHGCTAIFDGSGGDYVLGGGPKDMVAADYMKRHGPDLEFAGIVRDVANATGRSIWSVLASAARHGLSRQVKLPVASLGMNALVSREIAAAYRSRKRFSHGWFDAAGDITPGTLMTILALSSPPMFYDPLCATEDPVPDKISPLLSTPVVELCLRIPRYTHMHRGRDRGLAREAFLPDVPRRILDREWKDRAAGFAHQVVTRNLAFIREVLLNGSLIKDRLLDRQSVEAALSGRPTGSTVYPLEIFAHLATEFWLQATLPGSVVRTGGSALAGHATFAIEHTAPPSPAPDLPHP